MNTMNNENDYIILCIWRFLILIEYILQFSHARRVSSTAVKRTDGSVKDARPHVDEDSTIRVFNLTTKLGRDEAVIGAVRRSRAYYSYNTYKVFRKFGNAKLPGSSAVDRKCLKRENFV